MNNGQINGTPATQDQQLRQRQAKNIHTLSTAGTILVSTAGTIYFDLNSKGTDRTNNLRELAGDIARFTGGRVSIGDIHPLTNSPGTLVVQLPDMKSDQAQSIFASLANTGNAYAFAPVVTKSPSFRLNDVQNSHEIRAFAERCFHLSPGPNGRGAIHNPERTLMGLVHNAVAISAVKSDNIFDDRIFVPCSLYDRDPVKALIVEAFLQSTAERNRGAYAKENFVNGADHKYVAVHSLTGEYAVKDVINQLNHSDLLINDNIKAAVIIDMELNSTVARANIKPPAPSQREGDILRAVGIGSNDIEAFGVPLGFYTPPKIN